MNHFPWWKNCLIILIVLGAFFLALPNWYGTDPSIQISGSMDAHTIDTIKQALATAHVDYQSMEPENRKLLIRLSSTDLQLKAKEVIQNALGENAIVALNLAPATPHWVKMLNLTPMKLGLDLRGGVHLLLQVDVDTVVKRRLEGDLDNMGQMLRSERIRYTNLSRSDQNNIAIQFRTPDILNHAYTYLTSHFPEFTWTKNNLTLQGTLSPVALQQSRQETLEQTMNSLRNRVNELGVSEAIVQQQGASRVVIDLPGIQDTAEAKNILGNTATLEFHMVDSEHDPRNLPPIDTKLYDWNGQPYLLKDPIILNGSSITSARSGVGEDARSSVEVRLGGNDALFSKTTSENIGKPMAVVYVNAKPITQEVNGQKTIHYDVSRRVISVATIQSTLGNSFQITGLSSQEEARTLALLLRAGALPANVAIIEERQVGPNLGKKNIAMGILSVSVGFTLVVLFMAIYYGVMGLIADLALAMNLILIVAILSLLGATLTLSGIAGIVLTVGMAADANVLIFERIREELRNGMGIQTSIEAGYSRALVTIVDANVTTLIVALVLFSLGSGPVKAFAITLTVGLLTSMFTAITGTRAVVNVLYGRKQLKKISIGM